MKRAIPFALLIALLFAVPAIPQGDNADLAARVEKLEKKVAKQADLLKAVEEYMAQQETRRAGMLKLVEKSDRKGFLYPAPNNDSRRALLNSLRVLAGSAPKAAPKGEGEAAGEQEEE